MLADVANILDELGLQSLLLFKRDTIYLQKLLGSTNTLERYMIMKVRSKNLKRNGFFAD